KAGAGPAAEGAADSWKAVPAGPTLEIVTVRVRSGLGPPDWKLRDTGAAVAEPRNAALRFSRPEPVCCTVPDQAVALLMSSDRYCAAVSPGRAAFRTAAAPARSGVEKLVPCVSV